MLIDALTFKAHLGELRTSLRNARLEKVVTISYNRYSFIFQTVNNKTVALYVEASYDQAHLLLTDKKFSKSQKTPFNQSLRKNFLGAKLRDISQPQFDLVARLDFIKPGDISGDLAVSLIIELCPRKSNLLILDSDSDRIIDVMIKVPAGKNRYRTLLPGETYRLPPLPSQYLNPYRISENDWGTLDKRTIWGINAQVISEIKDDYGKFQDLINSGGGEVNLYRIMDKSFLTLISLKSLPFLKTYRTVNDALTEYYDETYPSFRLKKRQKVLEQLLKNSKKKLTRRLTRISKDMEVSQNSEYFQRLGDLILANLNNIHIQEDKIELHDIFEEDAPLLVIKIDPRKSLAENARQYFSRAKKARRGLELIQSRLGETKDEIEQVNACLSAVSDMNDIDAVERLINRYRMRSDKAKVSSHKDLNNKFQGIFRIIKNDIYQFWVGKNQKGNEKLLKQLKGNDIWMHTVGYHGAHLVIKTNQKNKEIPLPILIEAASIVAYHSKARDREKVEVDYTRGKYVFKQKGKVGAVTYSQQKTLIVSPAKHVDDLKK